MKKFYFNFRKIKDKYLITDDAGNFTYISKKEFNDILKDKINLRLKRKLNSFYNLNRNIENIYNINNSAYKSPGLHIIVTTLRCNHRCIYCQANAKKESGTDMSWDTGKKAIDMAFNTKRDGLSIEFQGGEPLLNWSFIKRAVIYARKKEKETKKQLELGIVTNLSYMDKKKADFFIENNVYLCTSLDGPPEIHNMNRIYTDGNSYEETVKWIKYFSSKSGWRNIKGIKTFYPRPNALLTVTARTLKYPLEIVDLYKNLNLRYIFIRPIMPFGYALNEEIFKQISYTPEEFIKFYKKAVDYIIYLNFKGVDIKERTLRLFLTKIIKKKDSNYLDLRSPCGATTGQITYNYDGNIYTCDEGRMLAATGDDFFMVGNLSDSDYKKIISAPATRLCAISSNLENQHMCFRCAYKPYCGICPVYNYTTQNNPWGNQLKNFRCKIYKGILDYIFELIKNTEKLKLFEKWVQNDFR